MIDQDPQIRSRPSSQKHFSTKHHEIHDEAGGHSQNERHIEDIGTMGLDDR